MLHSVIKWLVGCFLYLHVQSQLGLRVNVGCLTRHSLEASSLVIDESSLQFSSSCNFLLFSKKKFKYTHLDQSASSVALVPKETPHIKCLLVCVFLLLNCNNE